MDLDSSQLIKKGAEASLYLIDWHGRRAVMKKRLPKKYRPPELDKRIQTYRTIHEPQLLHEAKEAGVPTPAIYLVDVKDATIIMQYVAGKQVKQLLSDVSKEERRRLCLTIGKSVGKLHRHGVVHGDLTTSNMILNSADRVFFVDFGLGEKTEELEAKGVDLHLMKRALESTHYRFADECFKWVIEGYSSVSGAEASGIVLEKIREIERRGRYVSGRRERE